MRATFEKLLFSLLILFLPTQLGKHFWPDYSLIEGVRVDYLSPTLYVTDILIGLLLFSVLIRIVSIQLSSGNPLFLFKKEVKKQLTPPTLFYFLFLLLLVLSIFFSSHPLSGWYVLIKFLEYSFVALYVSQHIRNKKDFRHLVLLLGIGVLWESCLALVQHLQHHSLGGVFYLLGERTFSASTIGIANASVQGSLVLRPYGTFSHPNVLAGFLLIGLIMTVFTVQTVTEKLVKRTMFVILFSGSIGLLSTLSRMGIFLWLLFLLSFFALQFAIRAKRQHTDKRKHQINPQTFLLSKIGLANPFNISPKISYGILLLAVLFFAVSLSPLTPRFFQTTLGEESIVDRIALNLAATKMILSHPFFGVGLGNFLPSLSALQAPQIGRYFLQPVHNIFLLVGSEIGVIGLGFFLWFLGKTYSRIISRLREMSYADLYSNPLFISLLCLSAILFLGLFDHYFLTLQQGQLLFAFIIGLCWSNIS